jgi:broad specificity phosphatase PhoE
MTRVLLIRHGETSWNRERRWQGHADPPLSEDGIRQSARLAAHLRTKRIPIATVYSSDLRRASSTARQLASALEVDLVCDPAWREIDVGLWTGLSREEIKERFGEDWKKIAKGADLPRGGGETFALFSTRVLGALTALTDRHPRESVAVVTHGGVVRALLLHVLGLPWTRMREVEAVGNTAVSEIVWDRARWSIVRRTHSPHLELARADVPS